MKKTLFMIMMLLGVAAFGQQATRAVTGVVYEESSKQPIVKATVHVIGTDITTQTDSLGKYSINVPDGKEQLQFVVSGYATQKIIVGKQDVLDVRMKLSVKGINIAEPKGKKLKSAEVEQLINRKDTSFYRTIWGKVTDAKTGESLPGVTINIYDIGLSVNQRSVMTDQKGFYTAKLLKHGGQLKATYVGYVSQTVVLTGASVVNFKLMPDTKSMNETVIRGYVTRKREQTTGASYIVSGKEVRDNPVANVQQTLQGRVAGVNIQNADKSQTFGYNNNAAYSIQMAAAPKRNTLNEVKIDRTPGHNYNMPANVITNEDYERIIENQFINPAETPLSTFAVDVDGASYANVRRFINSGQLPPKNAVRIEELINYFKYKLPTPTNGEPVAIQTEVGTAPWNAKHQLVRIGLKAKEVITDKLPPSNLVFLIDVSGSMYDANKLPLVKTSLKMLVDQLRAIDKVAIVVYAGEVATKLESTPASEKDKIKAVIDQLGAGGGTAGGAGMLMAYQIAQKNFIKKGNNRIVMATDGDFNVGASSNKDMEELIEEQRKTGVSLSILGFGMGNYKDSKMELLANKGHGNYAYIDNITEATKSMVSEFGGTLFTVAKDVKIQVELNPGKVQAYRLLGYENRLMAKEDFNNDTKLGGDMGVGHTVTALYEIIPVGVKDSFVGSVDPLKYQKPKPVTNSNTSNELMTIKFRYKQPDGDVSKMQLTTVADHTLALDKTSDDLKFVAAVAGYGMLLRNSAFKQNADFDHLIALAKSAKGKDDEGYRAEFIRLAESTKNMMKSKELASK